MLLKSIEAQGFKSFADKVVLNFGKGMTAVVGPNGSGKSNISDAVRWVLGEQSTKTLRGHKMEDVIFGGTALRKPQGFAEVTLTIDNSDRSLNFDNDTVAVTRRYYRSGESEYQINKATVLLKNIHELFMDTGLGRDGYSMIGQGKIDSIVGSKSGERRDIFEEAAGISKYRYRKLEAERKLDRAEENLLRLNDIMAELEERVGPLAEQSKKAEEFLKYSDEKKELEIGLWLHTLSRAGDLLREQEEKIANAQLQYNETEQELGDIDEETVALGRKMQEYAVKIDEARRLVSKIEEDAARKEGEIAVLENTVFHNNESIARVKKEIEGLGQSDKEAEEQINSHVDEAQKRVEEIAAAEKQLAQKNEELQELITGSEGISRKIEELVLKLNGLSGEVSDWRVKMVTAQSSVVEIKSRAGIVDELIAENEAESKKLSGERKSLEEDHARISDEITSLKNTVGGYEMRKISRDTECAALKTQLDSLSLDIGEKLRRVRILVDLEQSMEGFSGSVKEIMKESKNRSLAGIHGPISRLIKTDKKYSTAIEIALGNKIQNIIVDREGDAKRAIDYLKKQKAGRATFLPIATIKGRKISEKGINDCDGIIGVASELIECDEKYREIIDNLLGNTVVAEDLDAATVAAKKFGYKFKIVTLDGQVVNAGGSLTGGSLFRNAGLLGRSDEIERLKKEAAELKSKSEEKQNEYDTAKAELDKATDEIAEYNRRLTVAAEDLIRVEGEQRRIGDQLAAVENTVATLNDEKTGAGKRLAELDKTAADAAAMIQSLEENAAAAQSEIDKATGGRDALSERRDALSSAIGDIKLRMSLLEKDKQSSLAAAQQIRSSIGNRAAHLAELDRETAGYNEKNEEIAAQIDGIKSEVAAMRENSAEIEKQITATVQERTETERRSNEIRTNEKERIDNKEKLGGELARLTERKASMLREHDEIIAKLFDEYGMTRSEAENSGIHIDEPAPAKRRLDEIKGKIKRLGNVNVGAIEEYKEVSVRYEFMKEQINDIVTSRDELHRLIKDLTSQMETQFIDGFNKVNSHFKTVFTELFGGGKGELQLSEPENVLESGIEIIVQPPGKKVSSIELLSGGEKALIALSIYFAIMKVNPPPFCMLDEVETALDDINVDRFAEYMHKMGDRTQFICITHRRGTMEEADMLYGVTMQEKGVSKLLELNVSELEKNLELTK